MKRKNILHFALSGTAVSFMVLAGLAALNEPGKRIEPVEAATLPTTIDLNDLDDEGILNYYSSLSSLGSSELTGDNLLKNLRGILQNGITYFSYNDASKIYTITDRDWVNSPASSATGNYNSSTQIISSFNHTTEVSKNPYIRMLYYDYTYKDKTLYDGDGDKNPGNVSFEKEHVWCQSHGFKDSTKQNVTGAGSDLHHLMAATQAGNGTGHSNHSYGFVKTVDSSWNDQINMYPCERANKRGTPLPQSASEEGSTLFEPQDSDKGDIARALFYMAACYNNLDGSTPTQANPALKLVNYLVEDAHIGFSTDDIKNGYYGVLQDMLVWHHLDPVDEYEIHRNNLIYNNYQHNRNPFIDYPEWVDYIWGTAEYNSTNKTISYDSTPTGSVDLSEDEINGYRANKRTLTGIAITKNPSKTSYYVGEEFDSTGMVVTASFDNGDTAEVTSSCSFELDTTVAGNKTLTVTYKGKTASMSITVLPCEAAVDSVSLDKVTLSLGKSGSYQLKATVLPVNAANKTVNWSSSSTAVATVDNNGFVTGIDDGECTITATSASDSTKKATCTVYVSGQATVLSDTTFEIVRSPEEFDPSRKIIIASSSSNYALSVNQNSAKTNRQSTPIIKNGDAITITDSVAVIQPALIENSTNYTLYVTNADSSDAGIGYLKADGTSYQDSEGKTKYNNYLKTATATDDYTSFSITFTNSDIVEITGQGDNACKYLKFNSTNSIFNCYSSGQSEISLYQQKEYPASGNIEVEGVSLDKTSMQLTKGGNVGTLTATVYPNEATNKNVNWYSTVESVATVNNSGIVTPVSPGTTTVYAETIDGGFTAECTVRVIPSAGGDNYYEKQTGTLTSGKYVLCGSNGTSYYPLPKTFPSTTTSTISTSATIDVDNTGKIETAAGNNYVVDVVISGSNISIKDVNSKYLSDVSASKTSLTGSSSSYTWTLTEREGSEGLYTLTSSTEGSTRVLLYSTAGAFGAYAASNIGKSNYLSISFFKFVGEEQVYNLDNFVSDILTKITCDSTGATSPTFAQDYAWSNLKTKFNSLTSAERTELKNYTADQFGNDEAKAMAKYDYIVSKYGTNVYENFIGRTITQHSNTIRFAERNDMIIMVIAVVTVTLSAGAFFLFRKKKEN